MAYGTFKGLKSKYYSEVTYTTDSAYSGISIFITDPKTMSLEEAIYTTGNKKPLAQMNPPGIAANKVVAKTNAAGFDTYGPDGMSFVGWHYVDGKYYLSGEKLSGINDTKLKNYINYRKPYKIPHLISTFPKLHTIQKLHIICIIKVISTGVSVKKLCCFLIAVT